MPPAANDLQRAFWMFEQGLAMDLVSGPASMPLLAGGLGTALARRRRARGQAAEAR